MYSDPPKNWTSALGQQAKDKEIKRGITQFALSFLLANLSDVEVEDDLKAKGFNTKQVEQLLDEL